MTSFNEPIARPASKRYLFAVMIALVLGALSSPFPAVALPPTASAIGRTFMVRNKDTNLLKDSIHKKDGVLGTIFSIVVDINGSLRALRNVSWAASDIHCANIASVPHVCWYSGNACHFRWKTESVAGWNG